MPTHQTMTRKGRLLRRSAQVVVAHVLTWSALLLALWLGFRFADGLLCRDGKHLETFGLPGILCTYERSGG